MHPPTTARLTDDQGSSYRRQLSMTRWRPFLPPLISVHSKSSCVPAALTWRSVSTSPNSSRPNCAFGDACGTRAGGSYSASSAGLELVLGCPSGFARRMMGDGCEFLIQTGTFDVRRLEPRPIGETISPINAMSDLQLSSSCPPPSTPNIDGANGNIPADSCRDTHLEAGWLEIEPDAVWSLTRHEALQHCPGTLIPRSLRAPSRRSQWHPGSAGPDHGGDQLHPWLPVNPHTRQAIPRCGFFFISTIHQQTNRRQLPVREA